MRIVITGINGFVGTCLANHFIAAGHTVTGIGRQPAMAVAVDQRCDYQQADITGTLPVIEADAVIHSAALASDTASFDQLYRNNVEGTRRVLDACRRVHTFVYVSSSSVYRFGELPCTESDAGKNYSALSGYGQTKFLAEKEVLNSGISSTYILRPRAIYGVNDRLILPRLLKLVRGNYLLLPDHVTQRISLTHIDNFVDATERCLNRPGESGIYNVADAGFYDLGEVITSLVRAVTRRELRVLRIPTAIWDSLISVNEFVRFNKDLSRFASEQLTKPAMVDTSAIRNKMNYTAKRKMPDSYTEIAEWIRTSGGWKYYLENYTNIISKRA